LAATLCAWATPARAHETRPGYLELSEVGSGQYDVLWKQPLLGDRRLAIEPVFPAGCSETAESRFEATPGALIARGRVECPDGLAGGVLRIAGLETTLTDVLVRVNHLDGRSETRLIRNIEPWVTLGEETSAGRRSVTFVWLGIEHILMGVDHLLFVLGLLLIVGDRWMLLKTITSFTLAHSITLAVATLGYASAPALPLNAVIALSILFLGPEIVRARRGETSLTIRHPWLVAFAFGLLHGFGFASGLTQMGLPTAEIPLALLLFNVGVELGQIAFVVLIVALERSYRVLEMKWPRWVEAVPGYAVGTLGAFWSLQRIAVLLEGL
jgi:hypothetical protein